MASTFQGGTPSQQTSGIPASMIGFGPASTPFFGAADPNHQRLQYYSSQQQQQQQVPTASSAKELSGRRSGKVKFFDTQKGFGFINDFRPEELGNEEVFVHYTSITAKSGFRSLAEGEEAEYEVVRGPKGFQAANVTGPGGQQVIGDSRRAQKPAFLPISPYAAMYPYIQQDPNSFYAASPYSQPGMLMLPGDFRGSASHGPSASYRAPYPANPSPYGSPAPIRPYDIGKEFASMGLGGGLTADEGSRGKPLPTSQPFGGMFGPIPSFDATASLPASSAFPATYPSLAASTNNSYRQSLPSGSIPSHSNSVDAAEPASLPPRNPADASPEHTVDGSSPHRPAKAHSRSASLLYASKPSPGL